MCIDAIEPFEYLLDKGHERFREWNAWVCQKKPAGAMGCGYGLEKIPILEGNTCSLSMFD